MSLIKCPECGIEISDKANMCINCGCPMEDIKNSNKVDESLSELDRYNSLLEEHGIKQLNKEFSFKEFNDSVIELYNKEIAIHNYDIYEFEKFLQSVKLNKFLEEEFEKGNPDTYVSLCYFITGALLNSNLKNRDYLIVKDCSYLLNSNRSYIINSLTKHQFEQLGFYFYEFPSIGDYKIFNDKEKLEMYSKRFDVNNKLYIELVKSIIEPIVKDIIEALKIKDNQMAYDRRIEGLMSRGTKAEFYHEITNILKLIFKNSPLVKKLGPELLIDEDNDDYDKLNVHIFYDTFFTSLKVNIDYWKKKINIENSDEYYYLTCIDNVTFDREKVAGTIICNNRSKIIRFNERLDFVTYSFVDGLNNAIFVKDKAREYITELITEEEIKEFNRKIKEIREQIKNIINEKNEANNIIYTNRNALFGKKVKEREAAIKNISQLNVEEQEQVNLIKKLIQELLDKLK